MKSRWSEMAWLRRGVGAMCLLLCSVSTWATVTYDGSGGVYANIFSANSQNKPCIGCHNTNLVGVARNGALPQVDFNFYENATLIPTFYGGNPDKRNSIRASIRVNAGQMPLDPAHVAFPLNDSEKALIAQWVTDVWPRNAVPTTVTTAASNISNSSATLGADVNENGADSLFVFEYGLASNSLSSVTAAINPAGTGGGIGNQSVRADINGLQCGTTYFYRVSGSNTVGSNAGSVLSFMTPECITLTITSSPILTGTEDTLYSYNVDASLATATFSLVQAPAGMNIDVVTGVIAWTPTEGVLQANVSVLAQDAGSGLSAQQDYAISVTPVNDPPLITSNAPVSAIEAVQYVYAVQINDPDDANNGSGALHFSLSNAPSGMAISNTGVITWTPGNGVTSSGAVTVHVSDGGENGAQAAIQTFTVNVTAVNQGPTITSLAPTTATEDIAYQYAVQVVDPDDANNGVDLHWSLLNAPAGMSISATGLISWTPAEGVINSGAVTVRVADGGENGAQPASQTFGVSVTPVNDPPVLGVIPAQTVTELSTLTVTLVVTDPDDANDGSGALKFSLIAPPAGMSVNKLGVITWTPAKHSAGVYSVTVKVADGGENGAQPATAVLAVTVKKLDQDGDGVADYDDNCPALANADQLDHDGDKLGDACDPDDDNDLIADSAESANGLDPFNAADAAQDRDGDGLSNLQEFQRCAANGDLICHAISVDSVAPVITTNGTRVIDAQGYVTYTDQNASAWDSVDGVVAVQSDVHGPLRPGHHIIHWQATDKAGNVAQVSQIVDVRPMVAIEAARTIGEGQHIKIAVHLNGDAPSYPVIVAYGVSGQAGASDHNLHSGNLTIASGDVGYIEFDTLKDTIAEADKTLVIQLNSVTANAILSSETLAQLVLVDRQLSPTVRLSARQGGHAAATVYRDGGIVQIQTDVVDINNDVVTLNWQDSDNALNLQVSGTAVSFDPANLSDGVYRISVSASDGHASSSYSLPLAIAANAPTLSSAADSDGDGVNDLTEGLVDSDADGVADYQDPVSAENLLDMGGAAADRMTRLVVTETGMSLQIGEWARRAGHNGARLASSEVRNGAGTVVVDTEYSAVNDIVDVRISGPSDTHAQATLVIPLSRVIPPNAVYRLLLNDRWQSFSESSGDAIYSALANVSGCPPLTSALWVKGLQATYNCVLLHINDGGGNDADGQRNGSVAHMGAVSVVRKTEPPKVPTESASGSGGSAAPRILLLLLLLAGWRKYRVVRMSSRKHAGNRCPQEFLA